MRLGAALRRWGTCAEPVATEAGTREVGATVMSRRTYLLIGTAMFAIGLAVRVNNALYFPLMRGYDAFAHFTYVWFLSEYGRIPLATAGWEFFQPPGFYALVGLFWSNLTDLDALLRLRVALTFVAVLGVLQAAVAWRILVRCFPGERTVHLLGAGLMLFVPVHLYSAPFFGNEGLGAVVCTVALLCLLRTLEQETPWRAAILGVALGAAMLVKFTGLVLVATAIATLGLRSLVRKEFARGLRTLAIVGVVILTISGWFYVRNTVVYGNPFQMSREELFLSQIENAQPQGRRTFLEYVLFDPLILYRPQWPRGLPLNLPRAPGVEYSALKESIPTGLYANTWFDGFGGFALPRVTQSELVRRAGQALLTLGLVPTLLMLIGLVSRARGLARGRWNDTDVTMLFATAGMVAVVVKGTLAVPTHAAVKATYLMPIAVAFSYWLAAGASVVAKTHPRWLNRAAGVCALLASISVLTFSHGWVIDTYSLTRNGGGPLFRNVNGVIYYAAGQRDRARSEFEWSAGQNFHLGIENMANLAFEDGHSIEAVYRLRRAFDLQAQGLSGAAGDRKRRIDSTLAEYSNSLAVFLYDLGWIQEAADWAARSRQFDPTIPESNYNEGIISILHAEKLLDPSLRKQTLAMAASSFDSALQKDPHFFEAQAMRGLAKLRIGDCTAGLSDIRDASAEHKGQYRDYPVKTGPGELTESGLYRRRSIAPLAIGKTTDCGALLCDSPCNE